MFNIVLVEPEIPQNTGNIVRTAAATGCTVHLIKPLGFDISDRALKRAGLDYWHLADFKVYESLEDYFAVNAEGRYVHASGSAYSVAPGSPSFYFLSTKSAKRPKDFRRICLRQTIKTRYVYRCGRRQDLSIFPILWR